MKSYACRPTHWSCITPHALGYGGSLVAAGNDGEDNHEQRQSQKGSSKKFEGKTTGEARKAQIAV